MDAQGRSVGDVIDGMAAEAGEPRRPSVIDLPPEAIKATHRDLFRLRRGSFVYFLIRGDECVYVGETRRLTARIASHAKAKDFDTVYYLLTEDGERKAIERKWVRLLRPSLNTILFKPKPVRRQSGRPSIAGPTKMRSLRFPDKHWIEWERAAQAEGISVTQWIVRACQAATKRRRG